MGMLYNVAMSWSWDNPSPEEAQEAYEYYRGKYYRAAEKKQASEHQEKTYRSEKNAAASKMESLSSRKISFEKRLQGIENIIQMLEGGRSWSHTNVPEAISKAASSIAKTDSSFRSSIRLTGGVAVASLEEVFKPKKVTEDIHSEAALGIFKAERARLQEALAELNTQISNLDSLISSLSKKINSCNDTQASLKSAMSSYAYDMNHYYKKTYD